MAYNYLADLVGEDFGQQGAPATPWTGGITGQGVDPILNRPPQTQQGTTGFDWNNPTRDTFAQYYASRGVNPFPTSLDYWQQRWGGLQARGRELGNPNYAFQRLQYADEFLPNQDPRNSPYYEGESAQASMAPTTGVQGRQGGNSVAPTWANMLNNSSAYNKNNGQTSLAALAGLNGYR